MFQTVLATSFLALLLSGGVLAETEAGGSANKEQDLAFSLNQVHTENNSLVSEIKEGTAKVPSGFKLVPLNVLDDERKVVDELTLLVSKENIITGESIKHLALSDQPGEIIVRLDEKGAKRLQEATRKMKLGSDRMAIIFKGRCLTAPTVQAILNEAFIISGIPGPDGVKDLMKALTGIPPKK